MQGWWTIVHLMPHNCSADGWPEVDSSVFLLFCYINPVASEMLSSSLLSLFWNNISLILKKTLFTLEFLFVFGSSLSKTVKSFVIDLQYFGQDFACELLHSLYLFCFVLPPHFCFLVKLNLFQTLINLHNHPTQPC